MNDLNPMDLLIQGQNAISETIRTLVQQNVTGDKFIPRRVDWNTTTGTGLATTQSLLSVTRTSPNPGKVWELRAVSILCTDPAHGSFSAAPDAAAFYVGTPPAADGTIMTTATLATFEGYYYDYVAGTPNIGALTATGTTFLPSEAFFVEPGQQLYTLLSAAGGAIGANQNMITRWFVKEYDADQILYGVMSTNRILDGGNRGILPRSQA